MSNDGLIIENIDLSHIHLSVALLIYTWIFGFSSGYRINLWCPISKPPKVMESKSGVLLKQYSSITLATCTAGQVWFPAKK